MSLTPRSTRVVNELRNQTPEHVRARLQDELRALTTIDSDRLHENALLVTALREAKIWPLEARP